MSRTGQHAKFRCEGGTFSVHLGSIHVVFTNVETELLLYVHGNDLCAWSETLRRMRNFISVNILFLIDSGTSTVFQKFKLLEIESPLC